MANKRLKPKEIHGSDMVMGLASSQKSGSDLMQNCDLPPPVKLFAGPDKMVLSSMNKIYSLIGQENEEDEIHVSRSSSEDEKLELLKALRLSQTRARDAERKSTVLNKEKDDLSNLLLQESLQLLAYQQWVRLLELQVSMLQRQQQKQQPARYGYRGSKWNCISPEVEDDSKGSSSITLLITMSFCLGVGIGYVFHCRYLF